MSKVALMGGMGAPKKTATAVELRRPAGGKKERKERKKKRQQWRPASSLALSSFTYRANCRVTEADELSPGAEFFTKGLIVGAIRGHYGRQFSVCLFDSFFGRGLGRRRLFCKGGSLDRELSGVGFAFAFCRGSGEAAGTMEGGGEKGGVW